MLDVDTQEGIVKAAVKPVVHSFIEAGGPGKDQQDDEEKEEFEVLRRGRSLSTPGRDIRHQLDHADWRGRWTEEFCKHLDEISREENGETVVRSRWVTENLKLKGEKIQRRF